MNLLHPDTFYEHNREYQKQRLEESQKLGAYFIGLSR